ncbi:MAG: bifunctional phosphoglucose/phosphomannose isomerase [Candidatus Pacebacteria bacterium]|nr:bifunctional phosphoglucose/phosphomannose isomerase [Candidatus Paceibacterota bacterium]
MKQIILDFPKQFKAGLEAAKNIKVGGPFSNVIICGIGGSALPGSLIPDLDVGLKIPLYTHRDYNLPSSANPNSLILAVSFSGNTEETISAYEEAIAKKYKVVALSTGGKLQEIAQSHNLPIAIVPNDCLQPRFGSGYLAAAALQILANCGLINDQSPAILEMANNLKPAFWETQGQALAQKLVDKIPVVYSSNSFKSLALIWKIKFNENAKVMAFWNYFPELNHNEMVGLTNLKGAFHFIIIKDQTDHERTQKRMGLFADLAREKGAEVDFVDLTGKTKMEKIFTNLLLGDWVTYYLALAYGQDPTPVKIVEDFKKRLAG